MTILILKAVAFVTLATVIAVLLDWQAWISFLAGYLTADLFNWPILRERLQREGP